MIAMSQITASTAPNPTLRIVARLFLLVSLCGSALAQQPQTSGEFWPAIDAHFQFRDNLRLLAFAGLKRNEDLAYQQVNAGLGLGYQWKPFQNRTLRTSTRTRNIHSYSVAGTNTCARYPRRRNMKAGSYLRPCRVFVLSPGFSFEIEIGWSFAG